MRADSATAHVDSGVGVNEDVATVTNGAAWVLDGATGLGGESHTPGATDATWYVGRVDCYLREHVHDDVPLETVLRRCVQSVAAEFHELAGDVDPANEPSAAVAVARWREDSDAVEYAVLGDASVVFRFPSGDVETVHGHGPREHDAAAVAELGRLKREEGLSHEDAFEALLPRLREIRAVKNTPEGYWVLSLDPDATDQATTGTVEGVTGANLFTDGVEPLVESYEVFGDWAEATSFLHERGPAAAVEHLREFERADADCETHPRFKQHDDAGIALVTFADETVRPTDSAK
ncbi:protein phosphatase 2C domain-containing protein [Haloarchaeobius sp. HME9146]|uniref:protein phosphatase 2C domain-containing protein n=1 Tax=Haloarchaeobius sp. HME9146 TaxID=2978732 RepID=UPI0021BF1081|nr:protein phosphatase 2C domain-containing protein [Haloarchaeobius sp. HME9146]MCT9097564.1 protein phosphatase 2C domain-containing protein [Haloarchaeobius sp. HME9146]